MSVRRQIRPQFYIRGGDWLAEDCSDVVGELPSRTYRRGEPYGPLQRVARSNVWELDGEWQDVDSTDDALAAFLSRLWERHQQIRSFCEANDARCDLLVIVKILLERPVFELSALSIRRLADLNAAFAFDIYDEREGQTYSQ